MDGWTHFYANRIQFDKNYAAFSIRYYRPSNLKTEYDKLQEPLQAKPQYHFQSFVASNKQSAIVGIAETATLMQYVNAHKDKCRETQTGEKFYFAPFADVDCKIYYVDAKGNIADITNKYKKK